MLKYTTSLFTIERTVFHSYASSSEKMLLEQATVVDKIDRILGPIGGVLQLYGDPVLQSVGATLGWAELVLLKIPFMYAYVKHTKDYDALASWLPREIIAYKLPFGGAVDITDAYRRRSEKWIESRRK